MRVFSAPTTVVAILLLLGLDLWLACDRLPEPGPPFVTDVTVLFGP